MLKKLSMSVAMAALMATGALAQNTTPTQPTQPVTPPAATAAAPAPKADVATTTTTSTTTKTESVSFKSAMQQDEMLVSKLRGLEVRNSAGENLGDINDIVLDNSGKATVAIVGVGGFLGLGEKNVGVPFQSLAFADTKDGKQVARLDTTKDALKAAPAYVYKDTTTAASSAATKTVSQ
jgi:sporulation protein YlmC with PRC-barrel domain